MTTYRQRLYVDHRWLTLQSPILLESDAPALFMILPREGYEFHYNRWVSRRWAELMRLLAPLINAVKTDSEAPIDRIEYFCDYDIVADAFLLKAEERMPRERVRFIVFDESADMGPECWNASDVVVGKYVYE